MVSETIARRLRTALRTLRRPDEIILDGQRIGGFESANTEIRRSLYRENYERTERTLLPQIVEPCDRVVEIGAALGVIGLAISRITPHLRMYEANPVLLPVIERNFVQNGRTADLVGAAVVPDGYVGETVSFGINQAFWSSSLVDRTGTVDRVELPAIRIGDVLTDFSPTIVVMDVEGAECDLLQGDLPGVRAILVELHAHITGRAAQRRMMQSLFGAGFVLDLERTSGEVATFMREDSGA